MRTTVTIDDDVLAGIELLRRERSLGLSAALNEVARAGLAARANAPAAPFRQRTAGLGMRLDVQDIGDVLDLLDEGPA